MTQYSKAETGFAKPANRKGFKKRHVLLLLFGVVALVIGVGVPLALQNRELVVSTINRNAGIAPMRIDLAEIEGGWLRAIKVRGLRMMDEKGAELISVAEVETELNLLSLAMNYNNLRTITIRGAKAVVDVQPGTTNIEEAIRPLLTPSTSAPTTPQPSGTPSKFPTGRIRIADAKVHARDSVDLSAWDFIVSEADVPFPTVEQPIPPMTLVGLVQQVAALPGESLVGGQFTIRTQPIVADPNSAASSMTPMKMNISTNGLPLQWFSLIKRRLPEIPIERILGVATVQADIEMRSNSNIQAQIQTAQIDSLRILAPALVGNRGAALQQIKLSGNVQLNQNRLVTQNAVLQCDIGGLAANANMPWPPVTPSLTQPWLQDADLDIQGSVDLARLIQVAPDLVQMQDQVQLVAGRAILTANQRKVQSSMGGLGMSPPNSNYSMKLGGLQANVQGNLMRWDEALQVSADVTANSQGQPRFNVDCTAEFCKIAGAGDLQEGKLTGQFDLAKIEERLSQWFALPVESLSGSANCSLLWKQDGGNRLTAYGQLKTTPVKIVNQYGQLDEPAWDGTFEMVARVDQGRVIQIDRGQAKLQSAGELLSAQVMEPISLVGSTPGMAQLPPAGIQLKLVGDLGGWQRRGQLFAGVDPGITLGGNCQLDAVGALDMNHIEVTQANFVTEPFLVKSGDTSFRESQLVGNFTGRVDSQNIGRLQVDNLLIQSGSFALQAKDAAVPNKVMTRQGEAGYRINPERMMSAIYFESSSGVKTSNDITVEGDVTGQIGWLVDPKELVFQLITNAKNIRAVQNSATPGPGQLVSTGSSNRTSVPSVLWEEPLAKLLVDGRYDLISGKLELPKAELMTEWIAYAGKTTMTTQANQMKLVSLGSMTYDAARVAQRLKPWTGDYLAVQGQRTQPVDITWTSSQKGNWAESLQANSKIGWDSASIVGIDIGTADFPLKIENGHFVSRAEIPVSKGTLRWNLDSDVAGNPIIIHQSPEKVIENVAITPQMCRGWLKYVAPILADVASVQGNLSLQIDEAAITPADLKRQTLKGQLQVHGANVGPGPLADQLLGLVQQVRALRKGAGATDGGGQQTSWLQLPEQQIGFAVEQGRVAHRNMQIQAGDVVINTSGSVGIDGQLELIAAIPIQKDWVDKTPLLQSLAGQQIQIPVRGSIQRPQLDMSSFASIGQQLATAAVQGAAQKQIDKGLGKLLGPLSQQLGPFQQGMQQMQQGVQQNLPQLPSLPNFQIPGFGGGNPFGGGQPIPPPQPQ